MMEGDIIQQLPLPYDSGCSSSSAMQFHIRDYYEMNAAVAVLVVNTSYIMIWPHLEYFAHLTGGDLVKLQKSRRYQGFGALLRG